MLCISFRDNIYEEGRAQPQRTRKRAPALPDGGGVTTDQELLIAICECDQGPG